MPQIEWGFLMVLCDRRNNILSVVSGSFNFQDLHKRS